MKTAPFFVAGLTASAALAAGVLLAAEDRALFEPQHAMLVGLVDAVGAAAGPAGSALDDRHELSPVSLTHDLHRPAAMRARPDAGRPHSRP